MKIWYYAWANSLFIFKKIKSTTSQARFKWADGKIINLLKYLLEFRSSMKLEIATQMLAKSNYSETSE